MRRASHPVATAILLGVAALVLAPLVSLVLIALIGDAELWPHLAAHVLPNAALNTFALLAGVAVIAAVAGVGTAWIVTAYEFPGRSVLVWLLPLPLAFPTYIVAYVYVDILDGFGPVQTALRALFGFQSAADYWFPNVRSLPGAIFVMGFVLYPYVYLATRAMFQTQSATLIEMARSLGASRWPLARDITLPLARPAIAAGLALALLEALNDIGASEYLGVQTLTLSIFSTWLNRSSLPGAAQIACVMLIAIAGLIALERYGRRRQAFTGIDRHPGIARRIALQASKRWLAWQPASRRSRSAFSFRWCFWAIRRSCGAWSGASIRKLLLHTANTVLIAACATVLTLALGFGVAFALRLVRRRYAQPACSSPDWATPCPARCWRSACSRRWLRLTKRSTGSPARRSASGVGLVLAGSSAAVMIAYAVRFLAIATGFAQSGLARISHELDDAARTVGVAAERGGLVDPTPADAPRAVGRGAAGVRRLPEGAAGDAAAAPAQCRDAVDLHLPVRHPRQLRGRRAGRADHRAGRHFPGDPHGPPCRRGTAGRRRAAVRNLGTARY